MRRRSDLHRQRDAILRRLPSFGEILRGSLFERHLRCGKPRCRCAGGEGHRVFYVGVSFAGGRTEQITVPVELLPVVRRWIDNYERWRHAVEEISRINRERLRERLIEPETGRRVARKRSVGSAKAPRR